MKISFDGHIMELQPDALTWEPPRVISRDGNFAPIVGMYWGCRLSLGKIVEPSLQDWQTVYTQTSHTAILPHPFTGAMTSYTCYVDSVAPRMDTGDQASHCAAVVGFDVTLAGITI